MKVYYIRHGVTQWNLDGIAQGRSDIPLCDEGRRQAEQTALLLKDKQLDLCICSPLSRARETAEIVLSGRNVPIIFDERIAERCFGSNEGKPYFSDKTEEYRTNMWDIAHDGEFGDMETIASVVKRVYSLLDELKEKYPDKNVLISAHGGLSPAVKYYVEGKEVSHNYRFDIIKNCQIIEGEIN